MDSHEKVSSFDEAVKRLESNEKQSTGFTESAIGLLGSVASLSSVDPEKMDRIVRSAIHDVNKTVRKNPWEFVLAASVGGLVLGSFLGSQKPKRRS
jgi:ElaB/YqjD/DUF883 family membrane-anchored ribosome-binding protein